MTWAQAIQKSSIWDLRLPCDSWLSNHNMWGGRKQFPSGTKKPDPTLIQPAEQQEARGSPSDPWLERFHGDGRQTDSWGLMRSYEGHPHTATPELITSSSLDRPVHLSHPRPLFLLLLVLLILSVWPAAGKKVALLVIDPSRERRPSNPALATVTMCREAPRRFRL